MDKPYKQPEFTFTIDSDNSAEVKVLEKFYITFEMNVIAIELIRCALVHAQEEYPYEVLSEHLTELFGKEYADTDQITLTYEWVAQRLEEKRDEILQGKSDPKVN